ncbi:MAG: MBL fold metallo-hydrolase [Candidatus Omnitrophica bacterium]|nr:MBL fold metallo-hydrolase [Candidatus Omnitrophota bacterium]
MEVTILGSGTGTPNLSRNTPGLLVKAAGATLLFDSGAGTLARLLQLGITYHDINYIFYTHFHTDHTLDLASILFAAKYPLSLRTNKLEIIAAPGLRRFYDNLLSLYGNAIQPQAYEINLREVKEETFQKAGFKISTRSMLHAPESLGFRLEQADRSVVYSGDTDFCENIIKLGQKADLLILECSFPDGMKVEGHLTAQEAGKIANACGCKKLVLIHLYPVCQSEEIKSQVRKVFNGQIIVSQDLMAFNL